MPRFLGRQCVIRDITGVQVSLNIDNRVGPPFGKREHATEDLAKCEIVVATTPANKCGFFVPNERLDLVPEVVMVSPRTSMQEAALLVEALSVSVLS
jgi:hypothetical protein